MNRTQISSRSLVAGEYIYFGRSRRTPARASVSAARIDTKAAPAALPQLERARVPTARNKNYFCVCSLRVYVCGGSNRLYVFDRSACDPKRLIYNFNEMPASALLSLMRRCCTQSHTHTHVYLFNGLRRQKKVSREQALANLFVSPQL